MGWFGSLDLAYKYTLVFVSLLVLTILAGLIKVLYNRRKLKNFSKDQSDVEAGQKDEQVELNQREKDEGDLFGVRAIEAGFYAGIPQSRPTSRAGSITGSPSMSSNTLVGSLNSPKYQSLMGSSVTSLPLAHTTERSRDSETLPNSPPRRKSPPAITLRPSEAELNGRINHNAAVNMSLNVPPSPVLAQPPRSPAFGGSDSGDSDGHVTPPSLSPRSAQFKPDHYAPLPPQIPMPEGLRVSVHSAEDTARSQAASFNDPSPSHSPGHSTPSSPGHPPQTKFPTMPPRALRDEPRSLSPAHSRFSFVESEARGAGVGQSNDFKPERPSSPILLQPQSYQPTHQRDMSNASSVYSENRMSAHQHQHKRSNSSGSTYSYNYSLPGHSNRNSVAAPTNTKEQNPRQSASSSLLAPGSSASNQTNDPRFSEFYDAYYRHSQLGLPQKPDAQKRPNQLNLSQPTIVEVDSPLPSPNPQASRNQYGVAM